MRLVKKILILFGSIFLLFGCTVKNENDMHIDNDGKMKYEILVAFDREFLTNVINMNKSNTSELEEIDDNMMIDYVNNDSNLNVPYLAGLKKRKFVDGAYIGNIYTYEVENIDDISTDKNNVINIGNFQSNEKLVDQKLFTKNGYKYIANFIYELNNNDTYGEVKYISKFTLSLPGKPLSHNATSVSSDGKKMTWDLTSGKNNIDFSFSLKENRILYIASIVTIIFVVVSTVFVILGRKRGKK